MSYISKYDMKFLTFMNRKYRKFKVHFEFYDDYILWLYYDYLGEKEEPYYQQLENDLEEYVKFQSGIEREHRDKLIGRWSNGKN